MEIGHIQKNNTMLNGFLDLKKHRIRHFVCIYSSASKDNVQILLYGSCDGGHFELWQNWGISSERIRVDILP